MIAAVRQGLKDEGFEVSLSQLCRWFELPRRTQYYLPTKAPPVVKPELAEPVKALIEAERFLLEEDQRPLRRTCDMVGLSRAAWYRPPLDWTVRDAEIISALAELVKDRPARGFWKCRKPLRRHRGASVVPRSRIRKRVELRP